MSFGLWRGGRRTSIKVGDCCRWRRSATARTAARRPRSAEWIARPRAIGSIVSTERDLKASSASGRAVRSRVCRRNSWLNSPGSSRRVRIGKSTASCAGAGSISSAPSPNVDFHARYVGKLLKKLGFSHMSARPRHPAQDERIFEANKKNSSRTLGPHLADVPDATPARTDCADPQDGRSKQHEGACGARTG